MTWTWLLVAAVVIAIPAPRPAWARARAVARRADGGRLGADAARFGVDAARPSTDIGWSGPRVGWRGPGMDGSASGHGPGRVSLGAFGRRFAGRGEWLLRRRLSGLPAIAWSAGVAAVGAGAGSAVDRAPVGLAAGIILATVGRSVRSSQLARRRRSERRDLRTALSMIDAELAAGASESVALRAAAAVGGRYASRFQRAARACEAAGDVGAALLSAWAAPGRGGGAGPHWSGAARHGTAGSGSPDRSPSFPRDESPHPAPHGPHDPHDPQDPHDPHDDLWSLAAAWRVRSACGASLASIVHRVELDVADAVDRRRTVDTALAGPRSSALLLALLPVLGIVLGTAMGADPLGFLLSPGAGGLVLLVGVAADAGGVVLMRRLVDAGVPP